MSQSRYGLILLNLGTPDAPEPEPVGRYLREFLMDKRVIDIPWLLRWILVNILIVPKRKIASAEAYRTVWTERGSPLAFHLEDLARKVQSTLGSEFAVVTAMRYGNPSVEKALAKLRGEDIKEIVVFPLYPQFAESSTLSSDEHVRKIAKQMNVKAPLRFVAPFYDHPAFIESFAARLRPAMKESKPDHVLFSFHGLPERHVKRTDRSGGAHCLASASCCHVITDVNRDCYRAQCFATARALATSLTLSREDYTVSFQSRLGRSKWISPYTDFVIPELAQKGIRKVVTACPSFVADCLETVEEMGDRGAHQFREAGGTSFTTVECPNSEPEWVQAVAQITREALSLAKS